ncbi:hypothetical protein [His 1 virus]|uniref:Uncharacterized protein ORF5 n=1 Tax=His1 virus (isolate Australia/Victoria) TaxID=654912 RepID=Y005_HIS1I|nr:hypothetical protein His1V_gp05 [His 1 virus]Q25BJ0.1 RecName: Full=Uncharacterized protein ORF5 [His1 virus (isolate Victoria)]AAQ13720.1 hypothetical protein [His 1 virus]
MQMQEKGWKIIIEEQ